MPPPSQEPTKGFSFRHNNDHAHLIFDRCADEDPVRKIPDDRASRICTAKRSFVASEWSIVSIPPHQPAGVADT